MSESIRTVLATVFCVSLLCGILPKEGAGKYAGFAAGLVVVTVILSPLFSLADLRPVSFSGIRTEELEVKSARYIMDAFEKNLAERVKTALYEKTGEEFAVTVWAQTDEDGGVTGVSQAEISPYSAAYAAFVAELLGISENRVVEQG